MCALVVPRVMPCIDARARGSQYGAPRPVNAGTNTTSSLVLTLAASASTSAACSISPRPSRNHEITAPPMNTLPSSAYSVRSPSICHATVDNSFCRDTTGAVPQFCNRKQPVP